MKNLSKILLTVIAILGYMPLKAQSREVKNIVLVHGAFADGSSWAKVIPLLEAKGFKVTAVQNPLTSLSDDVNSAKRIIALQYGPVLLVGHSWGGVVISHVGNDPKVSGLVYVAAFAPDNGESLNDVAKKASPPPGDAEVKKMHSDSYIKRRKAFSRILPRTCLYRNENWYWQPKDNGRHLLQVKRSVKPPGTKSPPGILSRAKTG